MVWQPPDNIRDDIQSRHFVKEFDSRFDYLSQKAHLATRDAYLALDGQQRLQSLYIAFFGSYDGARLYFEIDHVPTGVTDETDYRFEFLTPSEAAKRPNMVSLLEVVKLTPHDKTGYLDALANNLCPDITDSAKHGQLFQKKRGDIETNINVVQWAFIGRPALLVQEIDQRHDYDQVLEIFQRVNSGGMVLSKSDLMFCTLKLKIQGMEEKFAETLRFLNQGGRHVFNRDFLIKTCLVLFNQGAKYEVSKLKNEAFVRSMDEGFDAVNGCLRQLVAWLDDVARIKCDRFLRSENALIPLVDYMMLSGKRDKPEGQDSRAMKQYLFMAFWLRLYSHGGDRVLDQIHSLVATAIKVKPGVFPIAELRDYITTRYNGIPWQIANYFFDGDADLMINIVDGGVLQIYPIDLTVQPSDLKLEVDHIFPRKVLAELGCIVEANHIGNYRLVVRPINRRKRAEMPDQNTDFFGRRQAGVEQPYEAACGNVTRETYLAFRNTRAELIRAEVQHFLELPLEGEGPATILAREVHALTLPKDTQPGSGLLITYDREASLKHDPKSAKRVEFGSFHAIVDSVDGHSLKFRLVFKNDAPQEGTINLMCGLDTGAKRSGFRHLTPTESIETLKLWLENEAPRTVPRASPRPRDV